VAKLRGRTSPARGRFDLRRQRFWLAFATFAVVVVALGSYRGNLLGIVALALVFVLAERVFALRRHSPLRRGWRTDIAHFLVNRAFSTIVLIVLVGVATGLRLLGPSEALTTIDGQSVWVQFAEALVVVELGSYWGHRMMHSVPFLWRIHQLHHSSTELDWLSAFRRHPIEVVLSHAWTVFPLFVLGFAPSVCGGVFLIGTFQAFFVHANIRFRFGPLSQIVATPEFHHWHHADDLASRDSNFAFLLPTVDRLFGTLYLPRHQRPERYGIDDSPPDGYLRQLAWPFTEERVDAHERPRRRGVDSRSTSAGQ
jgi:sterol desaturase/sphingolipid hydroxylase (fatty acid hydroxylase superfamily)